jgi:hypothetical protein
VVNVLEGGVDCHAVAFLPEFSAVAMSAVASSFLSIQVQARMRERLGCFPKNDKQSIYCDKFSYQNDHFILTNFDW